MMSSLLRLFKTMRYLYSIASLVQSSYDMNCRPWRLLAIVVFSSSAGKLTVPLALEPRPSPPRALRGRIATACCTAAKRKHQFYLILKSSHSHSAIASYPGSRAGRRCSIVMGGASPTFNYDYVAHVSARTRPSPSLLLGYVVRPGDEAMPPQCIVS